MDLVRKYVDLVRKYVDVVRKYVWDIKAKSQTQIRSEAFGEPREEENLDKKRTKRREEFVEPWNHLI